MLFSKAVYAERKISRQPLIAVFRLEHWVKVEFDFKIATAILYSQTISGIQSESALNIPL